MLRRERSTIAALKPSNRVLMTAKQLSGDSMLQLVKHPRASARDPEPSAVSRSDAP